MPKSTKSQPLSCLFAINKPTGQVSMHLLNRLQPLFSSSPLFQDPSSSSSFSSSSTLASGVNGNNNYHHRHHDRKFGNKKGRRNGGAGGGHARVKMGQGGTLDPLADGVLVIGTNAATKHLSQFLSCTKEYRAIGILGCSTDSYDSDGKRVLLTSYSGIDFDKIQKVLSRFRGEIEQVPPVYSALKMDGKPLYEYARSKTPLPRPIEPRKVTVHSLSLLKFTEGGAHSYEWPKEELSISETTELLRMEKMLKEGKVIIEDEEEEKEGKEQKGEVLLQSSDSAIPSTNPPLPNLDKLKEKEEGESTTVPKLTNTVVNGDSAVTDHVHPSNLPPIFEISMTVSSGTYVRSIVHDIGLALGSSAHVVKLTRTRQGEFTLDGMNTDEKDGNGEDSENNSSKVTTTERSIYANTVEPSAASLSTLSSPEQEDNAIGEPSPILETFAGGCLQWSTLEEAMKVAEFYAKLDREGNKEPGSTRREKHGNELLAWEQELLHRCKEV